MLINLIRFAVVLFVMSNFAVLAATVTDLLAQGNVVINQNGDVAINGVGRYLWSPTVPNGTSGSSVSLSDASFLHSIGGYYYANEIGINDVNKVVGTTLSARNEWWNEDYQDWEYYVEFTAAIWPWVGRDIRTNDAWGASLWTKEGWALYGSAINNNPSDEMVLLNLTEPDQYKWFTGIVIADDINDTPQLVKFVDGNVAAPGAYFATHGYSLNDSNQVVGWCAKLPSETNGYTMSENRAFVTSKDLGTTANLGFLLLNGYTNGYSVGYDINNWGAAVGYSQAMDEYDQLTSDQRAFIWIPNEANSLASVIGMVALPVLSNGLQRAYAINNCAISGSTKTVQIVGVSGAPVMWTMQWANSNTAPYGAYLVSSNVAHRPINTGWSNIKLLDINDLGQIVGNRTGGTFLYTP